MGRDAPRPLADRLRPQKLSDVVGQDHIAGEAGVLTRMLAAGRIPSIILWGPPGTGKTTIARLLAGETGLAFEQISAIFSGVADLKKVFEQARIRREQGRGTLLFVDEIHRFNKSQQDSFLPVVEDGTIILVGATTENPSFELNGALLSRSQVLVLNRLDAAAMNALIGRAEMFERRPLPVDEAARAALIAMADGDGRYFLNLVEEVFAAVPEGAAPLTPETLATHGPEAHAALRQGGGRPLQSHLRPAQVGARLGPGCGPLLSGPHAGGWRGSALHRAAPGAHGLSRMWGWPIRKRRIRRWPRRRPMTSSARPRVNWPWLRPRSISPPRPNPMRCTRPTRPRRSGPGRRGRWRRPRSFSMRRRN